LVDGATRLQALWTVFIPLALPALAVIALYAFTLSWNEFLFALLLIGRDSQKTIPIGLAEFVVGDVFAWGPLMAGSLLALLPPVLIYVAAQRWVVSGSGRRRHQGLSRSHSDEPGEEAGAGRESPGRHRRGEDGGVLLNAISLGRPTRWRIGLGTRFRGGRC
jgi:ABC-type Fe3+ transport system permease subunit